MDYEHDINLNPDQKFSVKLSLPDSGMYYTVVASTVAKLKPGSKLNH
jgi:hypothetical protein